MDLQSASQRDRLLYRVKVAKRELSLARTALRRFDKTEKRAASPGLSKPLKAYIRERDECDRLMGRLVKVKHGACQACGSPDRSKLQWAHGLSRRYRSVRYDWANSFSLCSACHLRYTHNPIAWTEWMLAKLGANEYAALGQRAKIKTRWDSTLVAGLRAQADALGVLTNEGWKNWQEGRC